MITVRSWPRPTLACPYKARPPLALALPAAARGSLPQFLPTAASEEKEVRRPSREEPKPAACLVAEPATSSPAFNAGDADAPATRFPALKCTAAPVEKRRREAASAESAPFGCAATRRRRPDGLRRAATT
jgi:hypothetical protein